MNKRTYLLALVVAVSLLLTTPASAGVLYGNGPINGNIGSWSISYGNVMSQSFTLTAASTLTGVNLGIWINPTGGTPLSLEWRLSNSPDTVVAGTTADLTSSLFCSSGITCGSNAYDVYASSFSLPNVVLGPGTYYLSLDFGLTSGYDSLFLDVNNGASAAYRNGANLAGSIEMTSGSNSSSFQILGDSTASTPEPASIAMLLSGLALFAGFARRKVRA